jgi:hypothetical protein
MSMAADIFNTCWNELEDARCLIRLRGRDVVSKALCTGLEEMAEPSDEGIVFGANGEIRYLLSDEGAEVQRGEVVEFKRTENAKTWNRLRAKFRKPIGGAIRLTVVPEYQ